MCKWKYIFREFASDRDIPWYLFAFKNRYFRLFTFLWALLFTTNFFMGWQAFSAMLLNSGVYNWLCSENSAEAVGEVCKEQYNAVQAMYTVGLSSEFTCTLVAGLLYDNVGPMYTAMIGEFFHILGWIVLIVSSKSVPLFIPGMILIGGSINIVSFPALSLAHIFPKHAPLMLSSNVAFQCGSLAVAPIVEAIWNANRQWTLRGVLLGYLLIFMIPALVVYPLSCPYYKLSIESSKRPNDENVNSDNAVSNNSHRVSQKEMKGKSVGQINSSPSTVSLIKPSNCDTDVPSSIHIKSVILPDTDMQSKAVTDGFDKPYGLKSTDLPDKESSTECSDVVALQPVAVTHLDFSPVIDVPYFVPHSPSFSILVIRTTSTACSSELFDKGKRSVTDWKQMATELLSREWCMFTLAHTLNVMQNGYYPTRVLVENGKQVSRVFGYVYPTKLIFCLLWGLPIDLGWTTTLPIYLILLIMIIVVFGFSLSTIVGVQYTAFVIFTLSDSFLYATKFTYFAEIFPDRNFGVLVGITAAVTGMFNLLNIPIASVGSYESVAIGYLCVGVVSCLPILYLWIYGRSKSAKCAKSNACELAINAAQL